MSFETELQDDQYSLVNYSERNPFVHQLKDSSKLRGLIRDSNKQERIVTKVENYIHSRQEKRRKESYDLMSEQNELILSSSPERDNTDFKKKLRNIFQVVIAIIFSLGVIYIENEFFKEIFEFCKEDSEIECYKLFYKNYNTIVTIFLKSNLLSLLAILLHFFAVRKTRNSYILLSLLFMIGVQDYFLRKSSLQEISFKNPDYLLRIAYLILNIGFVIFLICLRLLMKINRKKKITGFTIFALLLGCVYLIYIGHLTKLNRTFFEKGILGNFIEKNKSCNWSFKKTLNLASTDIDWEFLFSLKAKKNNEKIGENMLDEFVGFKEFVYKKAENKNFEKFYKEKFEEGFSSQRDFYSSDYQLTFSKSQAQLMVKDVKKFGLVMEKSSKLDKQKKKELEQNLPKRIISIFISGSSKIEFQQKMIKTSHFLKKVCNGPYKYFEGIEFPSSHAKFSKMENINFMKENLAKSFGEKGFITGIISDNLSKNPKFFTKNLKNYDTNFILPALLEQNKDQDELGIKQRWIFNQNLAQTSLNFAKSFIKNYKENLPIWLEIYFKAGSLTYSESLDNELALFLEHLARSKEREKTVVMITTTDGKNGLFDLKNEKKELRTNPALIILDGRFKNLGTSQMINLRLNERRIVGYGDIRKTLLGFLKNEKRILERKKKYNKNKKEVKYYDLYNEEIPKNRNCVDLGVPNLICKCLPNINPN